MRVEGPDEAGVRDHRPATEKVGRRGEVSVEEGQKIFIGALHDGSGLLGDANRRRCSSHQSFGVPERLRALGGRAAGSEGKAEVVGEEGEVRLVEVPAVVHRGRRSPSPPKISRTWETHRCSGEGYALKP